MRCKHCGRDGQHFCTQLNRILTPANDLDSFIISAAVAAITDSAILGGLLGGDIVGAVLGDSLDGDLFD